ncbi:leucyl/phenylalanyl-tRNA--protein transferase [Caulobacter mirabilis]|uniref:Leucyl/phenylalanyl-tRNA--protein transferase n=1 Tax=Caulobacter mirabilis TaxID=69666 RepID=A0A2D2AZ05_9CAUL|nr:leucyl/phenylalanyl-tRNA--protein transferase [Caulobacter mirabilis]ATQ43205.1 leucyl/phenylalanyl-tRNA--protein transferase [Caulobacter mirabilis]
MAHDVFDLEELIACYRRGVFPMADARDDDRVFLIDPQRRGVLPLEGFHIPSRLARTVRSDRFQITVDQDFSAVVEACAEATADRPDTWINFPIQHLYEALHRSGRAHSVEVRREGRLVGGLYGVSLGGAFFGESMFSRERDASKVALVHLVARLRAGGYLLLDAQFMTTHLAQFGAREIPRAAYRRLLDEALDVEGDFYRFAGAGPEALQAISQAS